MKGLGGFRHSGHEGDPRTAGLLLGMQTSRPKYRHRRDQNVLGGEVTGSQPRRRLGRGHIVDATDFLWGMYQEHCVHGRHHETQRSSLSSHLMVIYAGLLALLGTLIKSEAVGRHWPIEIALSVLGLFGVLFTIKQYERFRFHAAMAAAYRSALERVLLANPGALALGGVNIAAVGPTTRTQWRTDRPVWARLHLSYFWFGLHGIVAALGWWLWRTGF